MGGVGEKCPSAAASLQNRAPNFQFSCHSGRAQTHLSVWPTNTCTTPERGEENNTFFRLTPPLFSSRALRRDVCCGSRRRRRRKWGQGRNQLISSRLTSLQALFSLSLAINEPSFLPHLRARDRVSSKFFDRTQNTPLSSSTILLQAPRKLLLSLLHGGGASKRK